MQGSKIPDDDPFKRLRKQITSAIRSEYGSVESFCFEHDISKSILSRLLNGTRSEFKIRTLRRIAEALGKSIEIRLK